MSLKRNFSKLNDDWARTQSKLLAELGAVSSPRTRLKESVASLRESTEKVVTLRTTRASSKEAKLEKCQPLASRDKKMTKLKQTVKKITRRSTSVDNNNKSPKGKETMKTIDNSNTKEGKKEKEITRRNLNKKAKDSLNKSKEIIKSTKAVKNKDIRKRKSLDGSIEKNNNKRNGCSNNKVPNTDASPNTVTVNIRAKRRKNSIDKLKENYEILSKELAIKPVSNMSYSTINNNTDEAQVTQIKHRTSVTDCSELPSPKPSRKRKNSNLHLSEQSNFALKKGETVHKEEDGTSGNSSVTDRTCNGDAPAPSAKQNKLNTTPQSSLSTSCMSSRTKNGYTTIVVDGKTWTVPTSAAPTLDSFPLPIGIDEKKPEKVDEVYMFKEILNVRKVQLCNGVEISVPLVPHTPYECGHCGRMFRAKQDLRKHIYIHLDIRPHPCTMCNSRFRQRGNLKTHMTRMHAQALPSAQTFICDHCGARFFVKERIRAHVLKHAEKSYACEFCNKRFARDFKLRRHMRDSHGSNRFFCYLCNASYIRRVELDTHIKKHLGVRDLICHVCGKDFGRHDCISNHIKSLHQGIKRFQCPICNKWLKGHLREHMRTHVHHKPYGCLECGKRFAQSSQLAVHKRSHSGIKPYVCRVCKRPFTHSNALLLHIRVHTGEKPFACAMCPQVFSQVPHMKKHMLSIHNKKEAYKCSDCGEFFKLRATLDEHRSTWHKNQEEQQAQSAGAMSISKMRFLLAVLLRTIADDGRLKILGFNKRLIDDLLVDCLEATGHTPCTDTELAPVHRLRQNIQLLLNWTVPQDIMRRFRLQKMTTEQLLEELTS